MADADPARLVLRPTRSTDVVMLEELFNGLSPVLRYQRFLDPKVDARAVAADVAAADGYRTGAVVAVVGDRAVGVADWHRTAGSDLGQLTVVVLEQWQRRGVATFLVRALAARASGAGIRTLLTTVLTSNRPAVAFAESVDRNSFSSRLGVETTIVFDVATLAGVRSVAPVA